jgi:hypothetical protein
MKHLKCPVCGHEYSQELNESCPTCSWRIISHPLSYSYNLSLTGAKRQQEMLEWEQTIEWAKAMWQKLCELNKENLVLRQKNDSLSEKHLQSLQDIHSSTQHLPEILSILRQISEKYQRIDTFSDPSQLHGESEQIGEQKNYFSTDQKQSSDDYTIDDPQVISLVETYNSHGDFLDKIEVSETEDSKSHRWCGGKDLAIFEANHKSRGDYWIIDNQYLVPKYGQKINQHSYETISTLFECLNYHYNDSIGFRSMILVKPAKVSPIHDQEKWKLQDTGTLQF